MSPFPHLLLTEALHFCCPPTEIPWLLLCSYLCILLQMEVMSASTEALCSNTFPPVVSTNSRDEWTSAVFLFRSTPNCCDFWNVYLHTSSSLYVYIIMIGRGTLFTNNAHACVCVFVWVVGYTTGENVLKKRFWSYRYMTGSCLQTYRMSWSQYIRANWEFNLSGLC